MAYVLLNSRTEKNLSDFDGFAAFNPPYILTCKCGLFTELQNQAEIKVLKNSRMAFSYFFFRNLARGSI